MLVPGQWFWCESRIPEPPNSITQRIVLIGKIGKPIGPQDREKYVVSIRVGHLLVAAFLVRPQFLNRFFLRHTTRSSVVNL